MPKPNSGWKLANVRVGLYNSQRETLVVRETMEAKEACGIGFGHGISKQDLLYDEINLGIELEEAFGATKMEIVDVD